MWIIVFRKLTGCGARSAGLLSSEEDVVAVREVNAVLQRDFFRRAERCVVEGCRVATSDLPED